MKCAAASTPSTWFSSARPTNSAAFESGATAWLLGTVPAVVLGGVGTLVVTALWAWMFPDLRNADELVTPGRKT